MVFQCLSCLIFIVIVDCLKPTRHLRKCIRQMNQLALSTYINKHEYLVRQRIHVTRSIGIIYRHCITRYVSNTFKYFNESLEPLLIV